MSKQSQPDITIERFDTHEVINQPNPLRKFIYRATEAEFDDDPVMRAECALEDLSSEFDGWMQDECDRLSAAYTAFTTTIDKATQEELMRVAHDIKGSGATFGYPAAAGVADGLCRIIEHAPDLTKVPSELIAHHVKAITAIVREHGRADAQGLSAKLCDTLRNVADEYLIHVNRDRPEHLDAILATASPSIAPKA